MIIALAGIVAFALASAVIVIQIRRRCFFSLLTFYSVLFILENTGGAIKALLPGVFPDYASLTSENPLPWVPKALMISLAGYLFFLYGYACGNSLTGADARRRDVRVEIYFSRWWRPSYRLLLFVASILAIGSGFVQQWPRIRAAGGITAFLATAYQYRFGTSTETAGETMVVVLSSVFATIAVPLFLIWMIAWLRGRLSLFEKVLVSGLFLLLVMRQLSTMFRTVVIFTLISLIATYAAERRVKISRWIGIALVVFAGLVAVNFVHYYLYYLTAGWDQQGIVQSMSQLLAPHGHIYALAWIVSRADSGAPLLGGEGFVESLFFFVPRAVWLTKAQSMDYGTLLVQGWAGLPTWYQMAVTMVGELIAHFGLIGIAGMTLFGALYAGLDSLANRGPIEQAGLYGLLLARVLSDAGMGLSALAMTIFCLIVYFATLLCVSALARLWRATLPALGVSPVRDKSTSEMVTSRA